MLFRSGCRVRVRPVGVFWMRDEAGPDAKVLCVPARDPRAERIADVADVEPLLLAEIAHFFTVYKDVEPGKSVEVGDWEGRAIAERAIDAARLRHDA